MMKCIVFNTARRINLMNRRSLFNITVDRTIGAPKKEALEPVKVTTSSNKIAGKEEAASKCGPEEDPDDLDEMEEMFIEGPAGIEWNGPTRGGKRPEPTRYGDWERKGRASDF